MLNGNVGHSGAALRAAFAKQDAPAYLMEAHNALSARIVHNYPFDGIWASGLGISSAYGARDANEISSSEMVDVVERMVDSTSKPILVDVDSGFGDFNNVRLLTRKLSGYGVAGICIEDKLFPKRNSFIDCKQELAGISEFCGKLRAAKDAQRDDNFMVVARTEVFVTGGTLEQALKRAEAYAEAGADAILVHSKNDNADQVLAFGRAWNRPLPLVAVPTSYPSVNPGTLFQCGYRSIIWANHGLRASIRAINNVCSKISARNSIQDLDEDISTLSELFSLFNYEELITAEDRYFYRSSNETI